MAKETKTPSIYDKEWQTKKELGQVEKTFTYKGLNGEQAQVTATATTHPGSTFEKIEADSTETLKNGIQKMDSQKHARSIMKTVYGIDGTGLQAILDNKGPDLFNQMREFAFSLAGLSMTGNEVNEQKN